MNQQSMYPGSRGLPPMSNGDRNGSFSSRVGVSQLPPQLPPLQQQQASQTAQMNRAQVFEGEKKRIVDSCFSKRDDDDVQLESYITHVRVTEDAQYPSSPPPPDSNPSNKKNRVIVVAVRRSGKVRVHKARENPSGTFSIGKTWNLEELSTVVNYVSFMPATSQQQLEKQWAGSLGFIVTLGKPYYWQSPTAKEKDFFIASLVKIYKKYTGGKMPDLIGFSSSEVATLTGAPSSAQPSSQPPSQQVASSAKPTYPPSTTPDRPATVTPPPSIPPLSTNRAQSPYNQAQPPSRESNRYDQQDRDRGYPRGDNRPPARDGQLPPTRGGDVQPPRPDWSSPVPPSPRSLPYGTQASREDARRQPPSAGLQPTPLRPSLSPPPSQPALRYGDHSQEPPSVRANGYGATQPPPLDPSRNRSGSAVNDGASDNYGSSRPSTATTTDRKTPEPAPAPASAPSLPPFDLGLPDKKKLFDSRNDKNAASQGSSAFVTPVGTPSALKDTEQAKPGDDYFSKETTKKDFQKDSKTVNNESPKPKVPSESPLPSKVAATPDSGARSITPAADSQITTSAMTAEPDEERSSTPKQEEHRPGLGPMVKKKSSKDIAGQFRKAALAAAAFQPRQGGAIARLKALQQERQSNEPDGITSVVPAPLLRGMSSDNAKGANADVTTPGTEEKPSLKTRASDPVPRVQIERKATSDTVAGSETSKAVDATATTAATAAEGPEKQQDSSERARSRSPQRKRRQKLEAEVEKYCAVLGVDPRVMDGRGADFNELLTEFGWEGRLPGQQRIEDFETDVRREIGRAQASGWLGHVEQQEGKVQELAKAFDKAIAECEELDGLLTLYSHELDTLHDDIEYIEAQGQGLQVQTANQKILQRELQTLLQTLTISPTDLRSLHTASMENYDGVQAIEKSLAVLYRALMTIDPDIRQNKLRQAAATDAHRIGVGVYVDPEIRQMRAVTQKKEEYREETLAFLRRLDQHMKSMFKQVEQRTSEDNSVSNGSSTSLNLKAYTSSRQELWVYNVMMLFVRDFNTYEWQTLINGYEMNVKTVYQDQFRDYVMGLRKTARRITPEEQDYLFTNLEKEKPDESVANNMANMAARKLTVKRTKTTKTSALRRSLGEKQDGRPDAWNVFDTVLQEQASAIAEEQNFVVHFFHLDSQSSADFSELVSSNSPEQRKLPDLSAKQLYDPDREMAKIVQKATEGIYMFWPHDLQALMEWVVKMDHLQGVGILSSLEQCLARYEETNQEYICRTVRTLHERLTGQFHKFVEEQVKAIEETKVKVKKRRGLISFMRVFPDFAAAVEEMIPQDQHESLEVRFIVNDAYIKILKAMWESLNFIAKDNPVAGGASSNAAGGADPEDKEALNYHIMLIENLNFFIEEVKPHHANVVLEEWMDRAQRDQNKHLTEYTDAVIRRPLGKWLDFLESTETAMRNTENHASIASKPSHSKSSAKKILSAYDVREIRKGIETLRKRVEKHFTDPEDPSASKVLIGKVLDECAIRYAHAWDRMRLILERVYDGSMSMEWTKEDAVATFKR